MEERVFDGGRIMDGAAPRNTRNTRKNKGSTAKGISTTDGTDKHGFFTEGNKGNNGSLTQAEIMDGTGTAEYTEYAEEQGLNRERHFNHRWTPINTDFLQKETKGTMVL
jgi:hypothetical protein